MKMRIIGVFFIALGLSLGSADAVVSTDTGTENPIYITFVIHFDPLPAPGGQVSRQGCERERDNLAWLADYFDQIEREKGLEFVPKLTLEMAGDHAEYYSEDPVGLALLKKLYNKGHQLGVHFHRNYKSGSHLWPELPQDTPQNRRRVTADHIAEVDALFAKVTGISDASALRKLNRAITGHFIDQNLALSKGFDLLTGGSNEALNLFFDHDVYNPWRPASSPWPLDEDVKGPWLLVPQAPVLGAIGEHAPLPAGVPPEYTQGMQRMIWQDISIPAMQRKMLHLYLEWLGRRTDEKVWVFGWHEHTNNLFADDGTYGNTRNLRDEVRQYVTWLNDHFIGRRTADGKLIAQYATTEEVAQAFGAWESTHAGQSSFDYPVSVRDWEAYPYELKGLTRELMYAHYESEITALADKGVRAYKLLKADGRDWRYQGGQIVSTTPTRTIYLLWSEAGDKTVDFSGVLSGTVKCVAGGSGSEITQSTTFLRVTEEPIICTAAR